MKLFTIGDSVSQGFMSLAAARTDCAYSTIIAQKLGLELKTANYNYADWNIEGIPLNLEYIMRELQKKYGSNIGGFEWLTVLQTLNGIIDNAEDYYERGLGRADQPYDATGTRFFNNVAVWGFDAADSFQITPNVCYQAIYNKEKPTTDDLFTVGPDNAMYRTALKILNPSLDPAFDNFSQMSWLKLHATGTDDNNKTVSDKDGNEIKGDGIENLLLWLGANNALSTVTSLKIRITPNRRNHSQAPHEYKHLERAQFGWNLWHPQDFQADYGEMLARVDKIMENNLEPNWKVFVGTVPLVTIAPIAKGFGETTSIPVKRTVKGKKVETESIYYKYYTYFPFQESFAFETNTYLTMQDALYIDNCIREYNDFIFSETDRLNKKHGAERYFVVDTCKMLEDLAYKRNKGQPPYELPNELKFLYPPVNTKYYHADREGVLKQGGLFSLDGVHPTAIGQGIIAYEFLKAMEIAKVKDISGKTVDTNLNWTGTNGIIASDLLYTQPLKNMQEIYGKDKIASLGVRIVDLMKTIFKK